MSLVIKKIGSSLLKSDKDFKKIATHLKKSYQKNQRIIVVVSALHGETDRLIQKAENISPIQCYSRELLLSLGEQKSCALLGLSLECLKIPYTIFCGSHLGIMKKDDSSYRVDEFAYADALKKGIVIVSGFHVLNEQAELINLGRGGSDFSAILLAHLLKIDRCELIKDVPGVYNTNPEWGVLGRYFEMLTFEQMLKLANQGVPVVQKEAIIFAKQYNVPFRVVDLSGLGTRIE